MKVPRLPNSGPKMGAFLEPAESVPILKGPKNGSEIRTRFWPPSPVNFQSFNSKQNGGKQASLGKVLTSGAELQLAAVADEQVGNNNNRQQKLRGVHVLNQRLNKDSSTVEAPCPRQCFRIVFQPPKTGPSFGWLLPPKADPHLRSVEIGKPLLNFKPSLRLPKMRQKTKPDFCNECNILS